MSKIAAVLVAATLASGVLIGSANAKNSSFNELVSTGYEIKTVTLIPIEVAKREQADVGTDTVAVTLQKGGSIAVCYFSLGNWLSANKKSLGNAAQCAIS